MTMTMTITMTRFRVLMNEMTMDHEATTDG